MRRGAVPAVLGATMLFAHVLAGATDPSVPLRVWPLGDQVLSTTSSPPPSSTRTMYVTVVDRAGHAVAGLTPDDFVVKEGGTPRVIASVSPATERMRLALIVADSMVEQPSWRIQRELNGGPPQVLGERDRRRVHESLTAFVERLCPVADIALFTVGWQTEKLVDFTSDPKDLVDAIRHLPRDDREPVMPAESVAAVARQFQGEKPVRPVIVVATPGRLLGADPDYLLDEIAKSRAQVWAVSITKEITVGAPYLGFPNADPSDVPRQSGGRSISLLDLSGLQAAMRQVADDLSNQYLISYSLPDGVKASDRVEVSLKRSGATLLAPRRASSR